MTKERSNFCHLDVLVFPRHNGIEMSYEVNTGLRQNLVLIGLVDNPDLGPGSGPDFSAPHFHGKPARIKIWSPADQNLIKKVRADYMGGSGGPCGCVRIRDGVEPKTFEFAGETVAAEPVEGELYLPPDAFEAICRQAAAAYDHRRIMRVQMTLMGNALPETDDNFRLLFLKDLDISDDKFYGVTGFEMSDTLWFDHMHGRVLQVDRDRDEGYGMYLSILLTQARYKVYVERSLVDSISCEGRIINGRGRPYDGADVAVDFIEHESSRFNDELPERAFFGEFSYYPDLPNEKTSSPHFDFSLRYVPVDARDILIPLLGQEVGTQVVLCVNLIAEKEEILTATNKLRGTVRDYSFEVKRSLSKNA